MIFVKIFTWLSLLRVGVQCYKPIIFMHGVTGSIQSATKIFQWIKEAHPGTETLAISSYQRYRSFTNMHTQIKNIKLEMAAFMAKHPDGVHLICHSQGGLICRGVLETIRHNADTFISLSSPQAGQFAPVKYIDSLLAVSIKDVYKIAYTWFGQLVSVFNYWKDPLHQDLYRRKCTFLPVLNNETYNSQSQMFKSNFLRLNKLVMLGGPNDDVIGPWQSSCFGFYDENFNVVEMRNQKWYTDDSFGLRTLDERGDLIIHSVPGINHTQWHDNKRIFEDYILPYLT